MKKYFMAGTDDELQFGDMIELDFVGEEDGVTKHTHLEVKFIPELVDELLEQEIIEVEETKENKKKSGKWAFEKTFEVKDEDLIDFDDFREAVGEDIDELYESDEVLIKRIKELEDRVTELEDVIANSDE